MLRLKYQKMEKTEHLLNMSLNDEIQAMVRVVPDHPQPGIMYQDMASILIIQKD